MTIQEFIEKFADAIELEEVNVLTPETKFRELENWDSLTYLSVIAMLDEEFGIQIEMEDFRKLITIQDVYNKSLSLQ